MSRAAERFTPDQIVRMSPDRRDEIFAVRSDAELIELSATLTQSMVSLAASAERHREVIAQIGRIVEVP